MVDVFNCSQYIAVILRQQTADWISQNALHNMFIEIPHKALAWKLFENSAKLNIYDFFTVENLYEKKQVTLNLHRPSIDVKTRIKKIV